MGHNTQALCRSHPLFVLCIWSIQEVSLVKSIRAMTLGVKFWIKPLHGISFGSDASCLAFCIGTHGPAELESWFSADAKKFPFSQAHLRVGFPSPLDVLLNSP